MKRMTRERLPLRQGSITRDFSQLGRTAARSTKGVGRFTKSITRTQNTYEEGFIPAKYRNARTQALQMSRGIPSRSIYGFSVKKINMPKVDVSEISLREPDFDKLVPARYQGKERNNAVESMRLGWRQAVERDRRRGLM